MKNLILGFVLFSVFCGFRLAYAEVVINEVQLSPTGDRFIELYNSGSSSIDLTGFYIQRKTETGTTFGSLVSSTNFENKTIGSDEYFLISRSSMINTNIILDSLTLTESNTIQIKNSNGDIVEKIGWGNCGDLCVSENPTEGKSIQRNGNVWTISTPTPGASNSTSTSDIVNTSSSPNTSSSSSSTSKISETKVIEVPIKTKISTKTLGFVGIPVIFKANTTGHKGENIFSGRYFWNFGDGGSFEQINHFSEFSHTYFYPGEYSVSLDYYPDFFTQIPDTTNKFNLKIEKPEVLISKIVYAGNSFVELRNSSGFEIDISNWIILGGNKKFLIPKNTFISANKKFTIPMFLLGFSLEEQNNLSILTSTGESQSKDQTLSNTKIYKKYIEKQTSSNIDVVPIDKIEENNINNSATVINSGVENNKNSYLFYIIFALFIIIISFLVYFIRKNRVIQKEGEDFEILDE